MRLIFFDLAGEKRRNFYPLSLSRPIWELRCGMSSLGEKLIAKTSASDVACFVPDYMAESFRAKTDRKVNDPATLAGDDLLLIDGRVKAASFNVEPKGPSEVGLSEDGQCLYARICKEDLAKLKADSIESLLAEAQQSLATVKSDLPTWDYTWELVLANPEQITEDFQALGQNGIEGTIEEIGLRATRIRTLRNTLVSVPNSRLAIDANIISFEKENQYCVLCSEAKRMRPDSPEENSVPGGREDWKATCLGISTSRVCAEIRLESSISSLRVPFSYGPTPKTYQLLLFDWASETPPSPNI